jgi:hypothetical protein
MRIAASAGPSSVTLLRIAGRPSGPSPRHGTIKDRLFVPEFAGEPRSLRELPERRLGWPRSVGGQFSGRSGRALPSEA